MVDVRTFVANRQRDDMVMKRRQIVGDRSRMPVPPTRPTQTNFTLNDQTLSSLPPTSIHSTRPREQIHRRETHGFDTDAESLDESKIMTNPLETYRPSQGGQTDLPENIITLEIQAGLPDMRNLSRDQRELSGQNNDATGVPSLEDESTSEDYKGKGHRDHAVVSGLVAGFQSEDFISPKNQNRLNKSLFKALHPSQDHASDLCLGVSSRATVGEIQMTIPTSPRTPTPTPGDADPASNVKSQYLKTNPMRVDGPLTHRIGHNHQDALSSVNVENHLAEAVTIHQLTNRPFHPLSQNTPVGLNYARSSTGLTPDPVWLSTEIPFPHQLDHNELDGQSLLDSEPSDDNGPPIRIENEIMQGTLKRKLSLDYSPEKLHDMTFQELLKDPFDNISRPVTPLLSSGLVRPSLRTTLEQLSSDEKFRDHRFQHQSFFEGLSLLQYLESGEIIAEKLSELISLLSRIRQEKREVVGSFEGEIVEREAKVRSRIATLKNKKGVMTRQTEELTIEGSAK